MLGARRRRGGRDVLFGRMRKAWWVGWACGFGLIEEVVIVMEETSRILS